MSHFLTSWEGIASTLQLFEDVAEPNMPGFGLAF